MKKKSLILLSFFYPLFLSAQYNPVTIQTPNNTSVQAGVFTEQDFTSKEKNDAKNFWLNCYNNRITYIDEATYKYNCHGYAWHISNGGSQLWINTPEDDKYWLDYSYVEVSDPSIATKVSFGGPCYQWWTTCGGREYTNACDHSAITTGIPDYFQSKWGPSPLFRHHKNDCPYSLEDIHYYVRPSISGPREACSPTTYTVQNLPDNILVSSWSVSGAYTYIAPAGNNSATFTYAPIYANSFHTTTLTANISLPNGQTVPVNYGVVWGIPDFQIDMIYQYPAGSGPDMPGYTGGVNCVFFAWPPSAGEYVNEQPKYTWRNGVGGTIVYSGYGSFNNIQPVFNFPYGSQYSIEMAVSYDCGFSRSFTKTGYVSQSDYWYTFNLDPSYNYVDITANKKVDTRAKSLATPPVIDNIVIADNSGGKKMQSIALSRASERNRIALTNLPNGVYLVQLYGSGKLIETHPVPVNRK